MALEIVGIVASIVQLIDPVVKTFGYIRDLSNAREEQRALLSEMENLNSLLKRLQSRVPNNPSSSTPSRRQTLTEFKATMEHFTKKLPKAGDGHWSNISNQIQWPLWKKKASKDYLDKFERYKSFLNTWLLVDLGDAGQQQRQGQEGILKSVENAASQQRRSANEQQRAHDRILQTIEDVTQEQRMHMDAARRKEIIDWLCPISFFRQQNEISSARVPGTGDWLLEDTRFQRWKDSLGGILWCHGIPGAGKTVLVSMVVDHLKTELGKASVVAYIYIDHKKTEVQTPSNLLASLWQGLVSDKPICRGSLADTFYERHLSQRTRPSLAEVHQVLCSAVAIWSEVYVVVDALDEYPEDQRRILLRRIAAMGPTVKLMTTSRPHIFLDDLPQGYETLEIRATQEDIRRYVQQRIQDSVRLTRHVQKNPELRQEIETEIISAADGMFLLPSLHITSLAAQVNIKGLRHALKNLPKDLEHTYDEAMERIDQQEEPSRNLAYSVLAWVANAKRILGVAELREALAVEPDAPSLDPDNLVEIDVIISVCVGLVVVDGAQSTIRLIHYTTQHYLDSVQARWFPDVRTDITHRMLTVLAFEQFANISPLTYRAVSGGGGALLRYCAYSLIHAVGQPEERLRDMIINFLEQAGRWRNLWNTEGVAPWNFGSWPPSASLLWIAAASNLQHVAKHLLETNRGNDKHSAVHVASYYGHIQMVQLLLDHGVGVNTQGVPYGTALQAASYGGHEDVVRLLINNSADLNARGGNYDNALYAASYRGHKGVVDILIKAGADISLHGSRQNTALHAAAAEGHKDVVCLLIEEGGADVNVRGGSYGGALQAAAYNGHEDLVRLLIKKDAQVNVPGGEYGTNLLQGYVQLVDDLESRVDGPVTRLSPEDYNPALHAASCMGHIGIVQLLIKEGADVNALGGKYGTALQIASYFGRRQVVQLLLDSRAKDLPSGCYGTALQAASARGYVGIIKLLIAGVSNVNAWGGEYGTALQAAAAHGNINAAQVLIQHHAEINARVEPHGSALHAAMPDKAKDHKNFAKFLIKAGADINMRSGKQPENTLLQIAAGPRNDINFVRFLIDHNADVNLQGGQYGTALQAASFCRRIPTINLLIERGADVNLQGGELYGSALQAASYHGYRDVVQLLIDNGADINLQGGKYGTALQAASAGNHQAVVDLLIQNNADINIPGGEYGGSLQAALYHGHDNLVHLFLEKHANVNVGQNITPLHTAAYEGNVDMVGLLIKKGARLNTNVQHGKYGTALQAASAGGSEAVVERLIKGGADLNARGGEYGSAVQAASYQGHTDVVRLLVENGAKVHVPDGAFGSAMEAASGQGHQSIVQFLINVENKAQVEGRSRRYGNALLAASSNGRREIVRLLLEAGADVNVQGGEYGSPLQAACYKGNLNMVQVLVDYGANVNTVDEKYGAPLQVASRQGHKPVVELLIKNGADITAHSGEYGTALHAACCKEDVDVIEILLAKGAIIDALSEKHGAPLHVAAFHGKKAAVQLLISKNCDTNQRGGKHGSPLQALAEGRSILMRRVPNSETITEDLRVASRQGYWTVIRLLTEHGTNFNNIKLKAVLEKLYQYETVARLLVHNGADASVLEGSQLGP